MSASLRWQILSLANAIDIRQRKIKRRRQARALLRSNSDPFIDLTEAEFLQRFRLGKGAVKKLVEELTPLMKREGRSDGITRMMKTLVGQSAIHNVSQRTVSRALGEVTDALNKVFHNYVKWPTQSQECNLIKAEFYDKFRIPGVLGCVGGTHVAILKPHKHAEQYLNKKGFHSLNVMIICDSDLNILCVDPTSPGFAHNSSVWLSHPLHSDMKEMTTNGEQTFLLGDSKYPLSRNMITPVLYSVEGTPEQNYCTMHETACNTVQSCIGLLKARFRCLLATRTLYYEPVKAGNIVKACCVLHNIAMKTGELPPRLTDDEAHAERLQQPHIDDHPSNAERIQERPRSTANADLMEGRGLQYALIKRLWQQRNQ